MTTDEAYNTLRRRLDVDNEFLAIAPDDPEYAALVFLRDAALANAAHDAALLCEAYSDIAHLLTADAARWAIKQRITALEAQARGQ